MQLIVFSGLPGAGKSTVAEAVGQEFSIPVFAKDWLEAALLRACKDDEKIETDLLVRAGNELLTTLAERQLRLGQSALLDSVAKTEPIREQWRQVAKSYHAHFVIIECICSDETLHRTRLSTRRRGIPGWYEVAWSDIERVKNTYAPWKEPRLVLDAVNPVATNIQVALEYIRNNGP